jgi:YD repeat-containing protein
LIGKVSSKLTKQATILNSRIILSFAQHRLEIDRQITDTNQLGKTRSYGYDAVGSLVSAIDRNGRKRTYTYDALNRQTAENWLDSSNAVSRTFGYTDAGL